MTLSHWKNKHLMFVCCSCTRLSILSGLKGTKSSWSLNQVVGFKCKECLCFVSLHNLVSLPFSLSLFSLSLSSPLSSLPPSSLFIYWSLEETCLLFQPGLFPVAFAHSSQCLFCPSEADALNKMTTVICLCHSGPSTDYIAAQKYSAGGGGRMCVSAGSNSLFFLFSTELPFPLSLRWQVYLKPATTPPLIHSAPSLGEIRN